MQGEMMADGGHSGESVIGADEGGAARAMDLASDNPMYNLSLAEFTRDMKEDADQQQCLVPIVAKLLMQLVDANDQAPLDKDHITVFHAQKAPAVSVMDYSERIAKYSSCSYCCFVVGVIYMDRFIQQQRHMKKVCASVFCHDVFVSFVATVSVTVSISLSDILAAMNVCAAVLFGMHRRVGTHRYACVHSCTRVNLTSHVRDEYGVV